MTRKVETEACSPAPGGAAEDLQPVDTNNNSSSGEAASGPHSHNNNSNSGHSDSSIDCDPESKVCLKYALRPRSLQQHRSHHFDDADVECDLPPPRRNTSERGGTGGGRRNHKPRLLSRYRRKNANARERGRMRQINVAFEALKGVLPAVTSRGGGSPRSGGGGGGGGGGVTTLTKITTLRLAAGYIQALQDILDADERGEAPDDAGSAYSWLLSSLLQEDEEEEAHQQEDTNDHNAWALPYFINQGKRSLPTEVSKMEVPWPCGGTVLQQTVVNPPLKRLKHEPQLEYSDDIDEGKVTFIYTESTGLELEHLGPYPTMTDSDTINLLLDQKTNSIPSYDAILV